MGQLIPNAIYSLSMWGHYHFSGNSTSKERSILMTKAHYLHDVMAGATIGASYGIGLFQQARHKERSEAITSFWQILPIDNLDGAMAIWNKAF